MKKTIMALGYTFSVVIVLLIAGFVSLWVIGGRLDKESKAYVDVAIPAIVSRWDIGEIEKRASPEFNDVVDYDDLEEYFGAIRQLGNLVEYHGSMGDSNIMLSLQYGYEITADYTASADFEAGSADIQISLIKHDGQWQILDLTISPKSYNERRDII
jgi:hypothetical protein